MRLFCCSGCVQKKKSHRLGEFSRSHNGFSGDVISGERGWVFGFLGKTTPQVSIFGQVGVMWERSWARVGTKLGGLCFIIKWFFGLRGLCESVGSSCLLSVNGGPSCINYSVVRIHLFSEKNTTVHRL